MARTLIVSQDTASELLEAHASLAAWYFQFAEALRAVGGTVPPPSEAQRLAFLKQSAQSWPELAELARSIAHPRPYAPPPAFVAPEPVGQAAVDAAAPLEAAPVALPSPEQPPVPPPSVVAPAAVIPSTPPAAPSEQATPAALAPPPIVDPTKVRY